MPYLLLDPAAAQPAPTVVFGAPETITLHPMGKSLLMLRDRLKLELGRRTDIPDPQWNEWINDAYYHMYLGMDLTESKLNFKITTNTPTVSQPLYLLPKNIEKVTNLELADNRFTTEVDKDIQPIDLDTYRKLPVRTARPNSWFERQRMIVLWPTPDNTYDIVIDGVGRPAPLVADTDYPILEDKWHEALFQGAKSRSWEAVQNDAKSLLSENKQARQMGQLEDDSNSADGSPAIAGLRMVRSRRDLMKLHRHGHIIEPGD